MSQEKRRTGIPPTLLSCYGHNGTTMVTAGMFQEVDFEDAKSKKKLFLCSGIQGKMVKGGAAVRALASHKCGSGSNPGVYAIRGLSLSLALSFAPRGFSPGTPVCPSP